jgi:ATP synthase protein I
MLPLKEYGRYGSVGIELVLSIAIGFYGGRWIDGRVGGHGWITLAGFLGGVYAGFRALYRASKFMMRDIERAERKDRGEDPWSDERDITAEDAPRPEKPGKKDGKGS